MKAETNLFRLFFVIALIPSFVMKAIVIGSGVAGLATSIRLAKLGIEVEVFEANEYPGGKLSEVTIQGFRFDAGPSLFTLPHLVNDLYELCGKNPKTDFPYIQLEKSCNYFYEDGTQFTAYHDRAAFANELEQKINLQNTEPLFKYLDRAALRYNLTTPIFIEYSLHRLKNYTNIHTLKGILNTWKLNLFSSMNSENENTFNNSYLTQYFNRFATYNGSDPYQAPALLNMIPHLEHNVGTFFPKNGMHQITQSLYQLAMEQGVKFHFNHKVNEILITKGKVYGVLANQKLFKADLVISNADVHSTYRNLLSKHKAPEYILKQEKSSSALIFYWGINKSFPQFDLHNILFSADYKTEFEHLFKHKTIYHDPTIYINITSKYKPDDAPQGCENWFLMINVPNNSGQPWDELIQTARKHILQKLQRMLQVNVASLITCEHILEPRSIESKTSSYAGALYGNASNNRYAAFLRHKNFSSEYKGLYFCGGSVHPGGGIPLCLNSAKIVAQLIKEDYTCN